MLHKNMPIGDLHFIQQWEPADSTARAALSVTASDIGKVARQLDTGDFYILTDNSPLAWLKIGEGAVLSVNGSTGAVVINAAAVPVTPTGNIAATDAQAALAELDTEKQPKLISVNAQSASYTLVAGDASLLVTVDNAAANTVTIPPNSSVAFPIGTLIHVKQLGLGQTTIAAGVGVTMRYPATSPALRAQYSLCTLQKVATDTWDLFGDFTISSGGSGGITLVGPTTVSGTSVDFTGIPATVSAIDIILDSVSTNGTSVNMIQLGDSGGIENTGYTGIGMILQASVTPTSVSHSSGFSIGNSGATDLNLSGVLSLRKLDSTTWAIFGGASRTAGAVQQYLVSGVKSLSATLDRIRLTTFNGTDTFDAGRISIQYH